MTDTIKYARVILKQNMVLEPSKPSETLSEIKNPFPFITLEGLSAGYNILGPQGLIDDNIKKYILIHTRRLPCINIDIMENKMLICYTDLDFSVSADRSIFYIFKTNWEINGYKIIYKSEEVKQEVEKAWK